MRSWGRLLGGLAWLVVLSAHPTRAFIPQAERVEQAVAERNGASGRAQALQLELTLRVAERDPIGTGVLVTHPTGLARLELRDTQGRVERHLLQGAEHTASRDGRQIESPRAFLPPLFLLQAGSTLALRSAMTSFGLDVDAIGLAPCGVKVCYVVGDPARVPPPSPPSMEEPEAHPATETGSADTGAEASEGALDAASGRSPRGEAKEFEPGPPPTIWIETESFEIVRLESREGVILELGLVASFGEVRFPKWLTIREPGREAVRFDFLQVVPVNAPAGAFKQSWLLGSPEPAADIPDRVPLR